ncbi:MAG: Uma2 family endonuclease, partial [Prochlorothrix sp.]
LQPDFLNDRSKVEQMPILAIEVISASQNIQDLLEKAQQLINAGVKVVWTIEPYGQSIFVTTAAGNKLFHRENITSEQISVDFTQIFPEFG